MLYIPVPALSDMAVMDVAALWFSAAEFRERRYEYQAVLRDMEDELLRRQHPRPTKNSATDGAASNRDERDKSSNDKNDRCSMPCCCCGCSSSNDAVLWQTIEGARGLEPRTERGVWESSAVKRTALDAVLAHQTQDRQNRVTSNTSALAIAALYAQHCQVAVQDARSRGAYDARESDRDASSLPVELQAVAEAAASTSGDGFPKRDTQHSDKNHSRSILRQSSRSASSPSLNATYSDESMGASLYSLASSSSCMRQGRTRSNKTVKKTHSKGHLRLPTPEAPDSPFTSSKSNKSDKSSKSNHTFTAFDESSSSSLVADSPCRKPMRREFRVSNNITKKDPMDYKNCIIATSTKSRQLLPPPYISGDVYSIDASTALNLSQRSLNTNHCSVSSLVTSSSSRPRLRRETAASSKRSLSGSNSTAKQTANVVENLTTLMIGNSGANNNNAVDSFHDLSSVRSFSSVSSHVSSSRDFSASTARPLLRREMSVSTRHLLHSNNGVLSATTPIKKKQEKVREVAPALKTIERSQSSSPTNASLSRPPLRREIGVSSRHLGVAQISVDDTFDKQDLTVPPRTFASETDKNRSSKAKAQGKKKNSNEDSFSSPLSTSVSSSSTNPRPNVNRQYSTSICREASSFEECFEEKKKVVAMRENRRRLRFVEKVSVLPMSKFNCDDVDTWLSAHDLANIKSRNHDVVLWIEQGIPVIEEATRGLEKSTAAGIQEMMERRRTGFITVIKAQEENLRKARNGYVGSMEDLAALYRMATQDSRAFAFVQGKLDTKESDQFNIW